MEGGCGKEGGESVCVCVCVRGGRREERGGRREERGGGGEERERGQLRDAPVYET